eukprot:4333305-Amphidinium_carterae.2
MHAEELRSQEPTSQQSTLTCNLQITFIQTAAISAPQQRFLRTCNHEKGRVKEMVSRCQSSHDQKP